MSSGKEQVAEQPLEPLIYSIRGHRVILDADLARVYGVATKRFNEAFKRNRSRFPADFAFQLTATELSNLRSQIATSSLQATDLNKEPTNWSQSATRSHGGRRYPPWGFTEHGALMAANVLR
ncbi:MAG: ORF6N domain-containing protein, partial [Burkholderiales bacterium]